MKTIAFFGTVGAGANITLVSERISRPFRVTKIAARFALGCENLLALRFYNAADDDAPTAAPPCGVSMLDDYGQVDYVVGDQDSKIMDHEVIIKESGAYLKVYAENADAVSHSVDVQMTIEDLEKGG